MADLDRAIAAAREALTRDDLRAKPATAIRCVEALRDLLAALDAARGQAVVWVHQESEDIEYNKKPWMGAEWQPLFAAPPTAIVTLPYGWHLVPRHLPDEVLVDTGDLDGYDGQRGNAEHRAWWESAIDSLALRVPCPVLTYTPAPPAAADSVALARSWNAGYEAARAELSKAPPAAAVSKRDESPVYVCEGLTVPAWAIHYANELGAYFKARGTGFWAIGPVQSRYGEAPPVAVVPPGYALVPVEPTPEMIAAAEKQWMCGSNVDMAKREWAAMLAAANKENNDG